MNKDFLLAVDHIIQSISFIEQFMAECTRKNFSKECMRYDAILRNLQTMAESTQRLPQSLKDRYPKIPWRDIAGFRNILVHDYLQGLDEDIIWWIVTKELEPIKSAMLKIDQPPQNQS